MKAMVFDKYGDPGVLHEMELPTPTPGPDQVLLRVRAVGMNPVDWKLRAGMFKFFMPLKFPKILGFDVCGEVMELGSDVQDLAAGDLVHGMVGIQGQGACSTHVCLAANTVVKKPDGMSTDEAAAIPLAGLTALQGLRNKAKLRSGERVLVIGASGGVGMFAVQIGKAMETDVTGVSSSRNVNFVRSLGADRVIAYDEESYDDAGPFDVIYDAVGALSFFKATKLLAKKGRFVCPVPGMGNLASQLMGPLTPLFFGGKRSYGVMVKPSADDVDYLDQLYAAGQLKVHIESTYPLSDLASVHERSASGRVVGKLILQVSPPSDRS